MLSFLSKLNPFASLIPTGIKAIKYFMDSTLREKVTPVAGSVLYCDLWVAVEHSGIYVGDGNISNIEVEGMAKVQYDAAHLPALHQKVP